MTTSFISEQTFGWLRSLGRATSSLPLFKFLFAFSFFWTIAPLSLLAQTTSTLQGTITDQQALLIAGAEVRITGTSVAAVHTVTSDENGLYRIAALPAGTYDLTVSKTGFAVRTFRNLEITLNRTVTFNITLAVGTLTEEVTVVGQMPLLETQTSSQGATILPQQIVDMPINGRNYLDLLQLVPGVALNRQVDPGTDAAVPILGERSGNAVFLVDGMPNSNAVDGGPAAPFDQDSILEFQVLTAGYKAEFGHGSGGVVNVVTKRGTNQWHGRSSLFHRNSAFDSAEIPGKSSPFLRRWDPSANLGGPVLQSGVFFFGSVERIRESRQFNFTFPSG